jgi:TIR domain
VSAGPEESASTPAQRVFISYRRQDSAPYAGRLYDAMVSRFGERNVFMDLDMPPGVDFVERITEAVSTCQVLIEIIGPTWATVKNDEGEVRIADPQDFVRLELEIALKRPDVTVIPVLVSGTQMPHQRDLPEELWELAHRNALELSDRRWRYDVGQLISALEELLAETTAVHVTPTTGNHAAAGEALPDAPPTDRAQIRTRPADRGPAGEWLRGRGRLFAAVGALAVLGVVLAIVALGGGSGGGGNPGFEPFTGAEAFKTVDVPAGWSPRKGDVDRPFSGPLGSGVKTILTGPDKAGVVEIGREDPSRSPQDHAREILSVRINRDGATPTKPPEQLPVGGRLAWLIEYKWNEEGLGPATVATCIFNAGDFGWRTRAAVAGTTAGSAGMAEEIATRMAKTLEPR